MNDEEFGFVYSTRPATYLVKVSPVTITVIWVDLKFGGEP